MPRGSQGRQTGSPIPRRPGAPESIGRNRLARVCRAQATLVEATDERGGLNCLSSSPAEGCAAMGHVLGSGGYPKDGRPQTCSSSGRLRSTGAPDNHGLDRPQDPRGARHGECTLPSFAYSPFPTAGRHPQLHSRLPPQAVGILRACSRVP